MGNICEFCKEPFTLPYKRTGQPKYCSQKCYHAYILTIERKRPPATCHPDRPHAAKGLCQTCYFRQHRARRLEFYQEASRKHLLKRYGLTPEQYVALATEQQWRCAICQEVPARRLAVDHDHATGAVRGLLCLGCNTGLGKFYEHTGKLAAAIDYLTSFILKKTDACQ